MPTINLPSVSGLGGGGGGEGKRKEGRHEGMREGNMFMIYST